MNYTKIIDEFLLKHNQHPSLLDIEKTTELMIKDMDNGLAGNQVDMPMIPTYISTEGKIALNEKVIAIDAGGTNLRIATVEFTKDEVKIENLKKIRMIGRDTEVNKQEFLDAFCDVLYPYLQYSHKVGLCWSFGALITPDMDGIVYSWGKEMKIVGCEGMHIGKEINKNLKKYGVDFEVGFAILNDTVATLLGGPAIGDGERVDGQIGLILGTGTNTAYQEKTSNITKISDGRTDNMIINMESCAFRQLPIGTFDAILDAGTRRPGKDILEKMVSGYYLGVVIGHTAIGAYNEGIFSKECDFSDLTTIDASDVDKFLREPYGDGRIARSLKNSDDVELMYVICDRALDRASKIVCANIACDIIKMDGGKKMSEPVRLVIEGSTYQYCYSLKERIDCYLRWYVCGKLNRYYKYVTGTEPNLVGSAAAALLNLR